MAGDGGQHARDRAVPRRVRLTSTATNLSAPIGAVEAAPAAPAVPPRQEVLLEEIRDLLKK